MDTRIERENDRKNERKSERVKVSGTRMPGPTEYVTENTHTAQVHF